MPFESIAQTMPNIWEAALALSVVLAVILVAYAVTWYRQASRARVITKDPTIGVDQIREARLAQLRADQAARLTARQPGNGTAPTGAATTYPRRLS